jgi:uncharacterized protein
MGKILFWAVVIIAVLLVSRLIAHQAAKAKSAGNPDQKPGAKPLGQSEQMIRCAHCGIYMPRSEAYKQDDQLWCGPDHAKAGLRQRP